MSCRRMVFAGLLVGAVAVAGCANRPEAVTAISSAAPTTTVAPRPMTDYLVSNADTPEITYLLPAAADAVTLGTVGVASGKNTPECAARNATIPMVAADPLTSALVRVETADGKPRYDVQIAVLNRVVDVDALASTMRACPAVNISVRNPDGSDQAIDWEVPAVKDIAGVGSVREMSYIRELGNKSAGSALAAAVVRFVAVGKHTVVEFISGNIGSYRPELSTESIALADRLLSAQVAKLKR
ncbi:hypothetical protein ACQPW1_24185 [Nocardia sp. CA-128927]|uniref:hypothetical protein n=1 Tax=Nocardia sp. CA-128927 TaxID=3239975 RepID=UPI003D955447